jgi:hypothetical protein
MNDVIDATKSWIEKVVVGLSFCPFAAKPFKEGSIRYKVINGKSLEQALTSVVVEMMFLDDNETTETTLIIFPDNFSDFKKYLELLDLSEQLLEKEGYEGVYQIASFHPKYLFAGTKESDPSNYTNRSPYPMLHILREDSLEQAIKKHVNANQIPEKNIQKANELGIEYFKNLGL